VGEATDFDFGLQLTQEGVGFGLQVKKLCLVVSLVEFFQTIEVRIPGEGLGAIEGRARARNGVL